MKRCLHILPMGTVSGAEKMALILCRNLKQYDPIVVCGGKKLNDEFRKNGIESYELNFSSKNLVKLLNNLKKIIKGKDIKIIHSHDNKASIIGYLVKKVYRLDIKVISHIHSCYPFLVNNRLNKKIDSFFRPRYDYNIACGDLVYDYYACNAKYFKGDKTNILPNAIDIEEILYKYKNEHETLRRQLNINQNDIVLGFIGRICNIKGIIPFIKEVAKRKEDFIGCKILLVGSGEEEEEVKRLVYKHKLDNLFILTGFKEDVYSFYKIMDIFFLPSLYEGLPMVILEAMAFKKAIVSMNVGSISQAVRNNKNGYLIDNRDFSLFLDKIIYLKNNKELRKQMGENSFRYLKKEYDIKKYVKEINNLYEYKL